MSPLEIKMKASVTFMIIFLLGVTVCALTMTTYRHMQNKKKDAIEIANFKKHLFPNVDAYYNPNRTIPIPEGLDFSTDTWHRLTFWKSFAAVYSIIATNTPLQARGLSVGCIPGLDFDNPYWMESRTLLSAWDMAYDALKKAQNGATLEELRAWSKDTWLQYYDNDFWPKRGEEPPEYYKRFQHDTGK